jgi:hypothetical protein
MGTFTRPLTSRPADRAQRLSAMMGMPFTLGENLSQQFQQGLLDSFGAGTVARDLAIPSGNTTRTNPLASAPIIGPAVQLYEAGRGMLNATREQQPSMTEDEYKASPYFRTDIPFEQGMTEARAEALAFFYDQKKVREFFGAKRPISTFLGQFGGQALDPINYVPVFGQTAQAAAVARIGTVAGRAVIGAGDAAINTAAFGLMTAGLRDQFGDDVGWQAMTSEIAMSALIGGAFGGVSGLVSKAIQAQVAPVDRKLEAAVADALTDLRSVKEARAVLNEAVADLANDRDISLTPNSGAVLERIANEATSAGAASRALREQTSAIPADAQVAITPNGTRVQVVTEVVELDSLKAASGALQVRNRNSIASAAQVEQIATELDPVRLMPSVDADSGAPIVGPDNVIDSGNGRVMAIRRASEAYPERYDAYRKAIEARGFSTEGMSKPVLISRRVTDLSPEARATFNAEANAPRAAQMSAVELAAMDRNALETSLDALDSAPVTAASNRAFVQRFLRELPPSARGALVDVAGNLNADGVRRIENALVAMAYGDVDLNVVRRFAEATDDNTRAIVGAMSDVAGKWAIMRREMKAGNISPEYDVTVELTEALRMLGQWREQAAREKRPVSVVIKEGMGQLDLLDGEVSPEAQVLISAFYRDNSFARAAGRDTIAEILSRVVDAATELGRPQLFGDAGIGRVELLQNVAVNEQWNLFTPHGAVEGAERSGGFSRGTPVAADRQGGGQGTQGSGREPSLTSDPVPGDFPIGAGVPFRYVRNTESLSADATTGFGQGAEPSGRYMLFDEVPNTSRDARWETGTITLQNPLFIRFGPEDYGAADNWKQRLLAAYDGRTGQALSDALREDGYDGVVTFDRYGPSEIVDLGRAPASDGLAAPSVESIADFNTFIAAQPARSLDELYQVVEGHQAALAEIGARLASETGADFKNPGVKKKATTAEKMVRKQYDSTSRLTDVVRAGYVVERPDQVDRIIAGLSERFRVLDEGWRMTGEGYFDRKVLVRFEDGTVGEVQFWHPDLLARKSNAGHALYEERRTTTDPARSQELLIEMRNLYLASLDNLSDDWLPVVDQMLDGVDAELAALVGRPASGNARSNASSESGRPDSSTSAIEAGTQSPSAATMAQAAPASSSATAGRPSQFRNRMAGISIDGQPLAIRDMPETEALQPASAQSSFLPNDGDEPAARLTKDETMRDIALAHGVDPSTGSFVEMADIDQIRQEGRLAPEDEADLAEADRMFADAEAYGRAIEAAVACVI